MQYIQSTTNNPYQNQAIEQFLFNQKSAEGVILFWQNSPCVVCGKYQNIIEEINLEYAKREALSIVRRISGGGTVFHDLGNLNFSIIMPNCEVRKPNYNYFLEPIVGVLQMMNIPISINSRYDLVVAGKKVSGSAQRITSQKILHHGTLLVNSNLRQLRDALRTPQFTVSSHATKSTLSSTTTIAEHYPQFSNFAEFANKFIELLIAEFAATPLAVDKQDEELKKLHDKFLSWEWVFGKNPKFTITIPGLKLVSDRGRIVKINDEIIQDKPRLTNDNLKRLLPNDKNLLLPNLELDFGKR